MRRGRRAVMRKGDASRQFGGRPCNRKPLSIHAVKVLVQIDRCTRFGTIPALHPRPAIASSADLERRAIDCGTARLNPDAGRRSGHHAQQPRLAAQPWCAMPSSRYCSDLGAGRNFKASCATMAAHGVTEHQRPRSRGQYQPPGPAVLFYRFADPRRWERQDFATSSPRRA